MEEEGAVGESEEEEEGAVDEWEEEGAVDVVVSDSEEELEVLRQPGLIHKLATVVTVCSGGSARCVCTRLATPRQFCRATCAAARVVPRRTTSRGTSPTGGIASPRRHASLHLTALELRTDGALRQTEQRPPRRSLFRPVRISPPARAAAAAGAATLPCT